MILGSEINISINIILTVCKESINIFFSINITLTGCKLQSQYENNLGFVVF